jgi:hypothetical protein
MFLGGLQALAAVSIAAIRFGPASLSIPLGGYVGANKLSVVRDGGLVSIARGWFLR